MERLRKFLRWQRISHSRLIIKYMGKLCLSERLREIYDYEMKLNKNAEKIIWVAVTVLCVYQEYSIQSSFYHIITSIITILFSLSFFLFQLSIRSPAYHRIFHLNPKSLSITRIFSQLRVYEKITPSFVFIFLMIPKTVERYECDSVLDFIGSIQPH